MVRNRFPLVMVLCAFGCAAPETTTQHAAANAKSVHWTYEGPTGPDHWGELSPAFALAASGKEQSPIDIARSGTAGTAEAPLVLAYHDTTLEVLNNGHTIEDDYHGGGSLSVGGRTYMLAQFHFHSPSEHTFDGRHAPMELHLVHKDAGGKLAVVGVMIEEGPANPELEVLWRHMPKVPGRSQKVAGVHIDARKLLPASLATYRYAGSLTTPPCSEQVSWFVLQQPITASAEQIATFRKVIHRNNRPVQPLHGRTITATK